MVHIAQKMRNPDKTSMFTYQIQVQGHLDDSWSEWFEHLAITYHPDGSTILTGDVPDQVRLFTILFKIRDLNLMLIAVTLLAQKE